MKFADIELPTNRKFGFFFTAVFVIAGIYFLYGGSSRLAVWLFIIGATFFVVTLVKADLLLPLNKLWMGLGLLIGMVVSPIVLGVIYFVLFTPIGLITRMFGRDELRLKLTQNTSHWKSRNSSEQSAESFKHQF